MTDRELLEAAAKAAGIELKYMVQTLADGTEEEFIACWNPLTDDGDALRLAVRVHMDILMFASHVTATSVHWDGEDRSSCYEDPGADPFAATRRAIVRAAAAMAGVS